MKVFYMTAKEKIEIEVYEFWAEILMDFNKTEANKKRVAKNHEVYEAAAMSYAETLPYSDVGLEMLLDGRKDDIELVYDTFALMEQEYVDILKKVYFQEMKQVDIAREKGVSPAAVYYHLKVAEKKFKEIYEKLSKET